MRSELDYRLEEIHALSGRVLELVAEGALYRAEAVLWALKQHTTQVRRGWPVSDRITRAVTAASQSEARYKLAVAIDSLILPVK